MLVIPALDLLADSSRSYAGLVAGKVIEWERAGFARVQLTANSTDRPGPDTRLIEDVLRVVHCPIQVAGRFDSSEDIDAALSAGAEFVVLGRRALDEFDWLSSAASRFPGQLMVASPARERRARTRGALRTLPLDLRDISAELAGLPIAGMVVQFAADATIGHPELALLEDVAEEVEFPVQFSGSAPSLATLRDLEFRGVGAAIIPATHLSAEFDEQTLARSFAD
jgi:phosphoribosylformimino-5-aminoimidazole carboxamide ribonucleotide (ProFAR) isomerase